MSQELDVNIKIVKTDNEKNPYDAYITITNNDDEEDIQVKIVKNISFANTFYNLTNNETFTTAGETLLNTLNPFNFDKDKDDLSVWSLDQTRSIHYKYQLDVDIIRLQNFVETADKEFYELELVERNDLHEQLELMQKLQTVLQRRANRFEFKNYESDSIDLRLDTESYQDITDPDLHLDFGGVQSSYSNKEINIDDFIVDHKIFEDPNVDKTDWLSDNIKDNKK